MPHSNHSSGVSAVLQVLRPIVDFQLDSVRRDVRTFLKSAKGALLDVGCGNQPFRSLVEDAGLEYTGADSNVAKEFKYANPDTVYYADDRLPFADATFDTVLCTEVLEHVSEPKILVSEILRILKTGGTALVTIP
jgi:2-polyprenyl-3-methyl-5-hydroxy-6-metoxy-1,4-benzoquinol methylase